MILYFVGNSIHQIPNFIYIAMETGGKVLTDSEDSRKVIREHYPEVDVEQLPTPEAVTARVKELAGKVVVQSDFNLHLFEETGAKQVQVFHGLSDKKYHLSRKVLKYDLTLLTGERMADQFRQMGTLDQFSHEMVGYSKSDRVFKGSLDTKEMRKKFGLNPDMTTVLYAPTWNDKSGNTSIPRYGVEVLSQVPDDIQLVVKLHPNTYRYDQKYYPRLKEIAGQKKNITFIGFSHDVIPVMATADLMIGDISAVTHEFIAFQKPLVFLDSGWHLFMRKARTWIWQTGDVVKKKGRVWPTVMERLAHPEVFAEKRKKIMDYIYYMPDGNAAKRSAEAIYKLVE